MIIISVIGCLLLIYLSYCGVLPFILAIAGKLQNHKQNIIVSKQRKILVLIPAYKEDSVIVETALQSLNQEYPQNLYDVVIIADSLAKNTIETLLSLNINVQRVSFEKSTKVKALNLALQKWVDPSYEGVVILDADNIMHHQFLANINVGLENEMYAIQGQRKAKNADTSMAFLDGASEDINNHIYCKGAYNLGLSSRLSGSGMAFSPLVLKNALKKSVAVGGFDKELELELTSKGIRIHYLEEAIIYDEKVRHKQAFSSQRTRWIQAQYQYLGYHLRHRVWDGIKALNVDYIYKVSILALPPRLLLPIIFFCSSVSWSLLTGLNNISRLLWILLILNITSFIVAIPKLYFRKKDLVKWLGLFSAVFQTLKALTNLSKARTSFLHTAHSTMASNMSKKKIS
tara:strand:+ start:626 stop:1828 length:1203 start_codon:yes stop_codon:yes gene_type:complete